MGSREFSVPELVEWYLQGPVGSGARLPVPEEMELREATLKNGVLYLHVSDHWLNMTALEERIAEACLVLTMTQFENVDQLCIRTDLEKISGASDQMLRAEDYVVFDDSATSDQVTVKLFFS